jgi:hypothetical protein
MNIKPMWKFAILVAGVSLSAVITLLPSFFGTKADCLASNGQTTVRWKNLYYGSCRRSWKGFCVWPIRRPHSTYKVTVNEGVPLRDENGLIVPVTGGKKRQWSVYDSTTWNGFGVKPSRWRRVADYEPIADNEYVVEVETRYRLFHNVEDTLRICTYESQD